MDYQRYMRRCLQLARLGEYYVAPNPMVGAVLVYQTNGNEVVIGEGWHQQYGGAHAEVNCFRDAERTEYNPIDMPNCTLFVSLEPCSHYGKTPPCADLIIQKGVKRVVIGCQDPNPKVSGHGIQRLRDAGIEVIVGVLKEECRALNKRFMCLYENHRPYITLKWAETADGYIDLKRDKGGNPIVISTPLTKQLVHQQRAENMAIMIGTRTAILDNPSLRTTRWSGRNPIRIVLDRHHIIPTDSKIFSPDTETIVYDSNTDWVYILHDLALRNIHSVLVEGGATLLNYIIDTGIYDEIHIEVSNHSLSNSDEKIGVAAPKYNKLMMPQIIDEHLIFCAQRGPLVTVP